MSTTNETEPLEVPNAIRPRTSGLTEEQKRELFAAIERRKNDPEYPAYLERVMEGVREYRQRIQEELERDLSEEETK